MDINRHTIRVNLDARSYDIRLVRGQLDQLGPFARQCSQGSRAVVVTDENVLPHAEAVCAALTAAAFTTHLVRFPPGENLKALASVGLLYDQLAEFGADRRTLIVPVGGGVIGDLAGFAAATFNRGLPLLMVPTTLLAMVDSSVGGKVGVNHPRGKNLIGAFHQPAGVWIDTDLLTTLPAREYHSGLAEVVKYGVILDAAFFSFLEENAEGVRGRDPDAIEHLVATSCRLKAAVVEQDEREETGLRAVLNYGHTFAHAFETVAGYGAWLHGEAVAAGMVCAARLAVKHGLIPEELARRQERLLEQFGLPVRLERWPVAELLAVMRRDKKSVAGKLRFVLPRRLGEVALFDDVPEALVAEVLHESRREGSKP